MKSLRLIAGDPFFPSFSLMLVLPTGASPLSFLGVWKVLLPMLTAFNMDVGGRSFGFGP